MKSPYYPAECRAFGGENSVRMLALSQRSCSPNVGMPENSAPSSSDNDRTGAQLGLVSAMRADDEAERAMRRMFASYAPPDCWRDRVRGASLRAPSGLAVLTTLASQFSRSR